MAQNSKRGWVSDFLIGLLLTAFVAGSYVFRWRVLESLELKSYDLRAQFRMSLDPSTDIVIIAIDDDSIERLGRWPWPRTRIAEMVSLLTQARPRVIGLDILYSEPERNPALAEFERIRGRYLDLVGSKQISQRGVSFETEFSSAAARLDTDSHLLAALTSAQNIILPMAFMDIGGTMGGRPPELPPSLSTSAITIRLASGQGEAPTLVEARKALFPLPPFIEGSAGVGHVNIIPDVDGLVRRETLAVKYGEQFFPSYALLLVARQLGLKAEDISLTPGVRVDIGNTKIPIDAAQSMLVTFNGPEQTFRYYSFHEVLSGKVPPEVFKDKIVLLGPSAAGVGTQYATPVGSALPSIEFIANVVENILSRRFLVRPEWAFQAEAGAILLIGLLAMFILPRLRALLGALVTILLLGGLMGAGFYFFKFKGEWVRVLYPSFLLSAAYVVIVTKRFFLTERGKELVEASQVETNKMLGLSFQGQGMLDMAFEKFRLVPKELIDDGFKDTLYNLGLDFERKRQYAKAAETYKHIAAVDPKYKDIESKIKTLQAAADGAVFGGIGGKKQEGTVVIAGGASKPTLGRYEIEKELGRGAMGIVYLGKDPKINRQVAIKTLVFDDVGSSAEMKEVKERFFREAESAGTLNHPGIVRVFDAGEEQDVCYIAMELLDGDDLVRFTSKDKLLPPATVLDYVARVAEALDYAHQQGIVHRDIKPANIMLLKDGSIRVTDFGIARITASSKTATGTVMGTPSYMSPEQIAGKKVDGRSDLFSLGVTLFELLTGEKPWKGGEGIGTLLYQIANEPDPDPMTVNPGMPVSVKPVLHKILSKKVEERYQRGAGFAKDLRDCIAVMQGGAPAPAVAAPAAPAAPTPAAAPAGKAEGGFTPEEIAGTLVMAPGELPELRPSDDEPAPGPAPKPAPVEPVAAAASSSAEPFTIELGPAPGAGSPAPEPAVEAAAAPPAEPFTIEFGPAPGAGSPAPGPVSVEPEAAEGGASAPADESFTIELGPAPGAGSPASASSPSATESVTLDLGAPGAAADDAIQAEAMRLVDSIMPRISPASLKPEDITASSLSRELEELRKIQASLDEKLAAVDKEPQAPAIEGVGDIRLSDPDRS